MTVRPARLEDVPALAQIHVASWQAAYRGLLPDTLLAAQSVPHRTQQWTTWLSEPVVIARSGIFVVEDEADTVAGFVYAGPGRREVSSGEIYAIYLRPDAFGKGMGQRLLAAGTAWLTAREFRSAFLWVLASNDRARRFYAAAGWEPDGGTQDEVRDGVILHELRYRRSLLTP
jgi:RimJ/RimL family protein N-acetyltransferase